MILLAGIIVQYNLTDVMAFSTPPSLCATSPIALPHPAILREAAGEKEDLTSPTVSGVLTGRVGSLKTGFIPSAFSEGIV